MDEGYNPYILAAESIFKFSAMKDYLVFYGILSAAIDRGTEMPILVLFAWRGQPDSLVAAYHREMADAPSVTVDQPQRTLHVFASREDGAVVMDLWENEDGFRRMMDDPEFRRNVEAADWPSDPKVVIYEVSATMQ